MHGELEGEIDATRYPRLDLSRRIDDDEYFGGQRLPAHTLHVLVVLPELTSDDESSNDAHTRSLKIPKLLGYFDAQVEELQAIPPELLQNTHSVEGFDWDANTDQARKYGTLDEDQLRSAKAGAQICYQAYLSSSLRTALKSENLVVAAVPKDLQFPITCVGDLAIRWHPNLLIRSDSAKHDPSTLQCLLGVRVAVEVKREISSEDDSSAILQLIALDLNVKTPAVALLTNLTDVWRLFWVGDGCTEHKLIHKMTIPNPGEALGVLAMLINRPERSFNEQLQGEK